MNKFALLWTVVFCATSLHLSAQKSPVKFGDVSVADLEMTIHPIDSTAEAVVLSDFGHAHLGLRSIHESNGAYTMNFERHTRIKILKKDGLKWADIQIPLLSLGDDEEQVTNLKAVTYNLENGKIKETRLNRDGVFKEKINRDVNLRTFTLPDVKAGSIIEFSYTIHSDFLSIPSWQFQRTIPTVRSEFWATIPQTLMYRRYMQGYVPLHDYQVKEITGTEFNTHIHHWTSLDVPALKKEPYMPNEVDFISQLNFALSHFTTKAIPVIDVMGSWTKLSENLLRSEGFGLAISGNDFLRPIVKEIVGGKTDQEEIVRLIHSYVKENIEWNGYKVYGLWNIKKVLEEKKGTSGDINILLASMLEKAGIPVHMVLCSTKDHGMIRKDYPMSRQFNYVVCLATANGKQIWLDATDKLLPVNVLPVRCLNGEGLLVRKEDTETWVPMGSQAKAKTVVIADLKLTPEGTLNGKLTYSHDGYNALSVRKKFKDAGSEEEFVKQFLKSKSWNVTRREFQNMRDNSLPAKENYEVNIEDHIDDAGDMLYINPFVCQKIDSNPFPSESRQFPVSFESSKEDVYTLKLIIPPGYKVEELPQSKMLNLPGNSARYVYNVNHNGDMVTVTSALSINKDFFTQEEYASLRELYSMVVAKQSQQIVLRKQ